MSLVAIVGRPNVGKSTLFNRLTETRTAEAYSSRDLIDFLWKGFSAVV